MTEIKPWQDRVKPGAFTGVKMEAMLAEIAELRAALAKSQPVERGAPVAWVRCHPDGTLTDELMPNSIIEVVRKYSGAWVPLFARPVCPMSDEQATDGFCNSPMQPQVLTAYDIWITAVRWAEEVHGIGGKAQ